VWWPPFATYVTACRAALSLADQETRQRSQCDQVDASKVNDHAGRGGKPTVANQRYYPQQHSWTQCSFALGEVCQRASLRGYQSSAVPTPQPHLATVVILRSVWLQSNCKPLTSGSRIFMTLAIPTEKKCEARLSFRCLCLSLLFYGGRVLFGCVLWCVCSGEGQCQSLLHRAAVVAEPEIAPFCVLCGTQFRVGQCYQQQFGHYVLRTATPNPRDQRDKLGDARERRRYPANHAAVARACNGVAGRGKGNRNTGTAYTGIKRPHGRGQCVVTVRASTGQPGSTDACLARVCTPDLGSRSLFSLRISNLSVASRDFTSRAMAFEQKQPVQPTGSAHAGRTLPQLLSASFGCTYDPQQMPS